MSRDWTRVELLASVPEFARSFSICIDDESDVRDSLDTAELLVETDCRACVIDEKEEEAILSDSVCARSVLVARVVRFSTACWRFVGSVIEELKLDTVPARLELVDRVNWS